MSYPVSFGPYLLLRPIGAGGMAQVFLASATGFGGFEKILCIKKIRGEFARNQDFVQLLIDEANIVSHVHHANVAQVFDLGKVDEQYYIAMEYVEGVDAFELLVEASERSMLLPVAATARIVRGVARGLAAAHEQVDTKGDPLNIIHRDISPHNVLVSFDGDIKIIDFGVAKASVRAKQTEAGVIKGKYNYLSPEQAGGKPLDPRTDVFSAGIVLFELLAGEPLYPGDNVAQLLDMARAAKTPAIRKMRKDVPRALQKILAKALKKNRNKRYGSALELADALDHYLATHHPDYTATDLAQLVHWLFPDRLHQGVKADECMALAEYVSVDNISIVSVPGVHHSQVFQDDIHTLPDETDFDAEPTRVASIEEILQRRQAKASGQDVAPVPIGIVNSSEVMSPEARKAWLRWIGASAVLLTLLIGGYTLWNLFQSPDVIVVDSTPPGANIWLDGQPTGLQTPAQLNDGVDHGRDHAVKLTRAGYEPRTVEVRRGPHQRRVEAVLMQATATLHVASIPPGAEVLIDGVLRGRTPTNIVGLDPSQATRIEIRRSGYHPVEQILTWTTLREQTLLERLRSLVDE